MEAQVGLGGSAGNMAEIIRVRERLRRRAESVNGLTRRLDSLEWIPVKTDGVIPLDFSCFSSWEVVLGCAGQALGSVASVATDGSLMKTCGMGPHTGRCRGQ